MASAPPDQNDGNVQLFPPIRKQIQEWHTDYEERNKDADSSSQRIIE
jgi:hypothetical protein